jgi:hypothetical protein
MNDSMNDYMNENLNDTDQKIPLHHISWLLEFTEDEVRENYRSFKVINSSNKFVSSTIILISLFYIAYWILVFRQDDSLFKLIAFRISFFPILLLWILLAVRLIVPTALQLEKYRLVLTALESLIIVGVPIGAGVVLIARISYGACDSFSYQNIWHCNPAGDFHGLPGDLAFSMLLFPLLFYLVLPFVPFHYVALSFLVDVLFVIVAVGITKAYTAIATVVMLVFLLTITGYSYRLHHMELFLYAMRYHGTLQLRAQDFVHRTERLREEMGNILSSICHDLKSVR